ncbi:hypothetical protein QL285_010100 [Trifolium repens]|nr:hypothetical protein QL285_010100 [Trifolium repens]
MIRGRGRPKKTVPPSTAVLDQTKETSHYKAGTDTREETEATHNDDFDENEEENPKSQNPAETTEAPIEPLIESTMGKKLWVEMLNGNRNPEKGMKIEFITPKVVNGEIEVEIDESDIINEVKFWDSALIMYVIGGDLSMNGVKQFMSKMWNFVKLPDMPTLLREWKPSFNLKNDMLRTLPIWVKLPQLPLLLF